MIHIRPFSNTDEDYASLVDINKVLEPEERLTVEMLRRSDEGYRSGHLFLERYMAEVDGRVAGSGLIFPAEDNRNILVFSMHIHPDFQAGEVPARMQNYLLAQMQHYRPHKFAAEPREDQTYRVRLLAEAGFAQIMRFPRSRLDASRFDPAPYQAVFETLGQQGIKLVTLTDVMQSDANWQHNVWRLFDQINRDVPYPEPAGETPFAEYAQYYEGDTFRPDSWAIALDMTRSGGERYVGMCVVNHMEARPDTVFAGITGTVRSHRRRKIATALKVRSILYTR